MTVTASGQPEFSRPAGRPVPLVLVVEDQPQLVRALRINLRARQYEVLTAGTGREALAVAAASPPDVMILDLGLPDVDGTEVIVAFRDWSRAPIIVLSGRTSPGDKIGALDAGADDYVTKPFAMDELLARLRAALRRDEEAAPHNQPVVMVGRWAIDLGAHTVQRSKSDVRTASADSPASRYSATARVPCGQDRPPAPAGPARNLSAWNCLSPDCRSPRSTTRPPCRRSTRMRS